MLEEIVTVRKWIAENLTDANANDWFERDVFVTKVQPILPAVLEVVALPPTWEEGKYNCFAYAFGVHKESAFLRKTKRPSQEDLMNIVLINSPHLVRLLSTLQQTTAPEIGDYVIYKNGRMFTHAGIYLGDKMLESKWSDGPIMRHHIHAVNPGYGDEIAFYKKGDPEEIKTRLIEIDTEFKARSSFGRVNL